MTDIPHFSIPFALTIDGAAVDEQDTATEIEACVTNIAVCPQGFRTDLPDFGLPDVQFDTLPLDTAAIKQAIVRHEPRAAITVTASGPVGTPSDQVLTIDVAT